MRHGSSFDGVRLSCPTARIGVVLVGFVLGAGAAEAQTRPGWVDPPARQPAQGGTAAPEKPVAESPAPVKSLAETPPAQQAAKPDPMTDRTPMASRRRATETPSESHRAREASERLRVRPRIARTPAMMAPAAAPSEARFPEWAAAATRLTDSYLDSVSNSGNALVADAPRFYAEQVQFHGRTLSLAALMAEKRRFAQRWPERRYEAQGGATRTACNAPTATCIVSTTFDFRADNPARGVRSQGVSELTLTISFAGPRPLIVAESSRVLRRYGAGPLSAIAGGQRGA